ncbi:TPR-like protein [Cadophora sp. DSE1049]|nr:TPR-like protein [Cadophora sp. DSE1049]
MPLLYGEREVKAFQRLREAIDKPLKEQPETPSKPSIVIPFSRDTDFVERDILDQINQKCAVSGFRTALVGLGGVGKSQLAIEYAYRTRDRSPETWVFWVHASNAARFEQSFREIAHRVKIPGRQNPTANIFELVHDWLCDERKGKWVLILDNVDDAGFLIEAQNTGKDRETTGIGRGNSQPLVSYLPQCQNGTILITTRTKVAALQLVEDNSLIAVEPMDKVDAVALLEKKLRIREDSDTDRRQSNIGELAAVLEYMPLAIVQAAAYVCQRAPRCSVSEYLAEYRKSDSEKTSLLDNKAGHLRRDREAKNSIIVTWHISFEHIRQSRPSAADLLSLMSLFDRQGIPEGLVRHRVAVESFNQIKPKNRHRIRSRPIQRLTRLFHHKKDDREGQERDEKNNRCGNEFEDDLLVLRNYAFISVSKIQSVFEMHALVQLSMRTWLEAKGDLESWRRHYCKILCNEFPTGEYNNWARCQELFPHAQSAAAQKPEEQDSVLDWASVLYNAAWYAWRMGKGVETESMAVHSMKVRKKILGNEHNDTLDGMAIVGLAYNLNGRWDDAEKLEVQVMETSKTKLGVDHPDTLTSMANLASTYRNQGRWDNAEELEVQVMETSKTKLGVEHLDTLSIMANLASTYRNQGRWDDAEKLEVQVMETRKTKLEVDHPSTLTSMANLASTYRNQGRWDGAEKLEVQVMETFKTKLGVDHPDTLTMMNNLAFTWKGNGKEIKAVRLMEDCVRARKRVLGPDHPDSISSCTTLDIWKAEQGRCCIVGSKC